MPSRRVRISVYKPRNSKMIPRAGDFSRAFRNGNEKPSDSSLRGQRNFSSSFDSTHQTLPREIEIAREIGLTREGHRALAHKIMKYYEQYGFFPGDAHVRIEIDSRTGEYFLPGVKRLRGRPRFHHEVKRMGAEIIRIRSKMKELIKQYPGINLLRELEEHHNLSDTQIVQLARSALFKLPKLPARKLIDEFEKLELAEHELIEKISLLTKISNPERKQTR